MFRYSDNCTDALICTRQSYLDLFEAYKSLETEANTWRDRTNACLLSKTQIQAALVKEENRKRIWRRIAIGEGVFILGVGALFYFL
jgi:hypothetical protein